MLSLDSSKTTLEDFPDELLLLICRYLSSTDVLFSFYGLNFRLSRMINDHFKHVVIAQIPYRRFQMICTSILPKIGTNIISLVLSNQWKGVLSKLFMDYFGDRMSSIFPNLEQLTLVSFNDRSLTLFLNILENLTNLHEIHIYHMYQITDDVIEKEKLLHRIFTANNKQVDTILFDDDSTVFSLSEKINDIVYPNIQRLSIDLKTINDLHRLLTFLPGLKSMNVAINKDIKELKIDSNIPMMNLKQFQLQSYGPSWTLEQFASILKRLPYVEELSIAIEIYTDIRLMNGEEVYPLISNLTLKKFSYFLRYYDSSNAIERLNILPSWKQFKQEFICVKSDTKKILFLYTLPFISEFLILPNTIATNQIFLQHYAPQVKIFTLSGTTTNTTDIFTIIQKFHRLRNFYLRIFGNNSTDTSKDIVLHRLSYLTKLTALRESSLNKDCFQKLLEISPNLYNLEINYNLLKTFFDDESICTLLKHRITHIYILITETTNIELFLSSISHLPKIFPYLRHIYFCFEQVSDACETIILIILKYLSEWKYFISLGVVGTDLKQKFTSKNLQQWIMTNSDLHDSNLFSVDCNDDAFRLWL